MSASHERFIMFGKNTVQYGAAVATSTTADTGSITDLAEGSLAIFNADTKALIPALTPAATDYDDVKKIILAVGTADADAPLLSPVIDRRGVIRWDLQDDVTGVAQVTRITPTLASPQTSRSTYELTVIDTSDPNFLPEDRETFHVVGDGYTVETLIDAFVLVINDSETGSAFVTASKNATTDLDLTAKTAGVTFSVALREELEGDTKAIQTSAVAPSGTASQLQALENEIAVYRGDSNRMWLPSYYFSGSKYVDTAIGDPAYDVYTLVAANPYERKDGMDAQYGRMMSIIVALPTEATQQDNFEGTADFAFGAYAGAPESGADAGAA